MKTYVIRNAILACLLLPLAKANDAGEKFPFAEGTFDAGGQLTTWTWQEVRNWRDETIGVINQDDEIWKKDNAAKAQKLGYCSPEEETKVFTKDVDLTKASGMFQLAIQVDDLATLNVIELDDSGVKTGKIYGPYEVKGTALWRKNKSYKEFSEYIPAGHHYRFELAYENTANLTDKHPHGSIDYDGVTTFIILDPTALPVDLDVDSNNNEGFTFKYGSEEEDEIEAVGTSSEPGKIIAVPIDPDADGDGVADSADGFDGMGGLLGNTKFVPMVVSLSPIYDPSDSTVVLDYKFSDPRGLSGSEPAPTSGFRIWTSNAGVQRSTSALPASADPAVAGYLLPPGEEISWQKIIACCEPAKPGKYEGPAVIVYLETLIVSEGLGVPPSMPFDKPEPIKITARSSSENAIPSTVDVVNIDVRCTGGVKLSGVTELLVNDDDDYGDEDWDMNDDTTGNEDDDVKFFTITATALNNPIKVTISSEQLHTTIAAAGSSGGVIDGMYPGNKWDNGDLDPSRSDDSGMRKRGKTTGAYTFTVEPNTTIEERLFIEGLRHSIELEDVLITAEVEDLGTYDWEKPCHATTDAEHRLTVYQVDLDIDSNNNEGLEFEWGHENEDKIENSDDPDQPGKAIIAYEVLDGNLDGVPDHENGIDGKPVIKGAKFTPMLLALPEPYDVASANITLTYDEAKAASPSSAPRIRVWRKDAGSPRVAADDLISSGESKTWAELGGDPTSNKLMLYVEAPNMTGVPGVGKMGIKVTASQSGMGTAEDKLKVFVMALGLFDKDANPKDKFNVGTMEKALTDSGVVDLDEMTAAELDTNKDADRFYVRLRGGGRLKKVSVNIATIDNPDKRYNDNPTERRLEEAYGHRFSRPQLLVSDDVDDDYAGSGVGRDDSIDDQTHKVQLGGKLFIEKLIINKIKQTCYLSAEVPVLKKVKLKVCILDGVVAKREVEEEIRIAQERYAQIGILLETEIVEYLAPAGVDLSNGINTVQEVPGHKLKLLSEAKALIDAYGTGTTNMDIHAFYVGHHGINDETGKTLPARGIAIAEFAFDPADKDYTYNILIRNNRTPFTLGHELGHLLTDKGHYGSEPGQYSGTMPADFNLMKEGTSEINRIDSSKRLDKKQRKWIYANPRVKNN